ncbi:Phosphoglucomutase, chloroplastic [Quillaja saponaria]|uniref:Phosphoglucomutase, chloroplastic n=1 Tax=Quillaja saponaria TaxID=32244 RepID=A0AAD7VHG7_QUISA|nr:Phosphoglucomutase, chloroplastic [Quillaja saponaria]
MNHNLRGSISVMLDQGHLCTTTIVGVIFEQKRMRLNRQNKKPVQHHRLLLPLPLQNPISNIDSISTKPIEGQKTGTSGLRKKVKVFMQEKLPLKLDPGFNNSVEFVIVV